MRMILKSALVAAGLVIAGPAFAETIEVQMYSKHPDDKKRRNVFVPAFVQAKPGDVIRFVSADKGHNSASKKGMLPEGVETWKSKLSKDFELTVEKPGLYGYVCSPHEALGMVGLIAVEGDGMLDDLEAIKKVKQKGKAKKVFKDLIAQAEALGSS